MASDPSKSLHRDYYLSDEIHELERELIFFREWFCAGRDEELPEPGRFLVVEVAGESVMVVRDPSGALKAHYNVGRHRGDRLSPEDVSLEPIGLRTWGGFVFVHLTPEEADSSGYAPHEHLGAVSERLEGYRLSDLRTVRRITYDVGANWKVIMEKNEDEKVRHKREPIYPNLVLSLSPEHVVAFLLWPQSPQRTIVTCDFLFHPSEIAARGFDPSEAVEFWDLVNHQDWKLCEGVQEGMRSRVFSYGRFPPRADASVDIRRYVRDRLGPSAPA